MAINIGINGFGRIGRLVFRSAINNDDFNVLSINDLLDINHLAYLLKYDSVHGTFDGSVEISDDKLIVNGKTVKITAERDPDNINWSGLGVDVVAEKFPLIGEYLKVIHNDTEEILEYIKNIKYENLSESDKKLFTDE